MRTRIRPVLALLCLVSAASSAGALTFQAGLAAATRPVVATDRDPALLAAVALIAGFEDVSAQVEAGAIPDYSILLSADLAIDPRSEALSRSVIDELVRSDVR